MKFDSVIFFANDVQKSVNFYVKELGLSLEYQQANAYASLLFENQIRLGIKLPTEDREIPGAQTLFIAVDNIEQLQQKLEAGGVKIYTPLKHKNYGSEFSILDPAGNKILFIHRL